MSTCSSGSSEAGTVPAESLTSAGSNAKSSTKSPAMTPINKRASQVITKNCGAELRRAIEKNHLLGYHEYRGAVGSCQSMRRNRLQVQPPAGPLKWHRFQELIGLL